ncbi:MAG: TRAP transporter large permease [Oscillibacter sp.]|nr:TRAP transporter large permease [Oscillibacter sp.]
MAAAINASAATIGPIIPPSIMMVVYGAYGSVSIASLFMGGIIPGVIVGLTIMSITYVWAKHHDCVEVQPKSTLREIWSATKSAFTALLVPFIIIAGILSGKFTATESGMVAVVYSLFLVLVVYRSCTLKQMGEVLKTSLVESAKPLLCIGGAGAFGYMMAYLRIPQLLLEAAGPIAGNKLATLCFITVLYIILGTFMDAIPAIIIFLPLVQEMAAAASISGVHMGVLVTVVLCFGLLTPPYGMTLLLSSGIAGIPTIKVIKELKWFYIVYLSVIVCLILFPDLILFLPELLA